MLSKLSDFRSGAKKKHNVFYMSQNEDTRYNNMNSLNVIAISSNSQSGSNVCDDH